MADQGRSDFCVVFTMNLCALELKQTLIVCISSHTALESGKQTLRNYLKLTCEYQFHTLSNEQVSAAKDDGESYMKIRPPLVHHLLRNRLLALVTHHCVDQRTQCNSTLLRRGSPFNAEHVAAKQQHARPSAKWFSSVLSESLCGGEWCNSMLTRHNRPQFSILIQFWLRLHGIGYVQIHLGSDPL